MADIVTVSPDSLGERAAATDDLYAIVHQEGGPLQRLAFSRLLPRAVAASLAKPSFADLAADLDHDADVVALVFNDPTALANGWYRKEGPAGSGEWSQFEVLAKASRDEIIASTQTAQAASQYAQAMANFRASFAEALADFGVGTYFASTASGALRVYQRVSDAPGYADQGDEAAPISRSMLGTNGAVLVGVPGMGTLDPLVQRRKVTLKYMGVNYASTADQYAALQTALANAAGDGLDLIAEPHATYRHDGPLTLTDVRFDGQGATLDAMNAVNCGLMITGTRPELRNVIRTNPATSRGSGLTNVPVLIRDAVNFHVENIIVDGSRGAGIAFWHAQDGFARNLLARNTRADGVHFSDGCRNILAYGLMAMDTGDDGVSIVSYGSQGRICELIRLFGAVSLRSAARGITVVGGRSIELVAPYAEGAAYAGVYISAESSYQSYGVRDVIARDAQAHNCCLSTSGQTYAGLQISGYDGTRTITETGEVVSNNAIGCAIRGGKVRGSGEAMVAGARLGSYTVGCTIDGVEGHDLRKVTSRVPDAFAINGIDSQIVNCRAENVGGMLVNTGTSTSGIVRIDRLRSTNLGSDGPVTANLLYLQTAPGITSLRITDLEHDTGAGAVMGIKAGGLSSSSVVIQRRCMINGSALPDSGAADWTYTTDSTTGVGTWRATISGPSTKALSNVRMAATDRLELVLSIRHSGVLQWLATAADNQCRNVQIRELVYSAYDSGSNSEAATGTAGVDYVATLTGSPGQHFQRNSAAPYGFVHSIGALGHAFAMTFDGTANVTIAFTSPARATDVTVIPALEYKHA
jgi:hypothetical protein